MRCGAWLLTVLLNLGLSFVSLLRAFMQTLLDPAPDMAIAPWLGTSGSIDGGFGCFQENGGLVARLSAG